MATVLKTTKWHTYNGEEHEVGDVYAVEDDAIAASIVAQGMAVETEKQPGDRQAEEQPREGHPVEPMGTGDFPGGVGRNEPAATTNAGKLLWI